MGPSKALLQAIAVTAELTGTQLSQAAAKVISTDLAEYPEPQILKALVRCRRELTMGRFTLAEVVARIDDGRPGPEEAWAMLPKSEAETIVWTDEMSLAYGVAAPLMDQPVQARMAFLERYRALVREAREAHRTVMWRATLGHNPQMREAPLMEAAEKGRLTATQVEGLLPAKADPLVIARLEALRAPRLEG